MPLSIALLLVTLALIFLVLSAIGKLPLWPAVLCLLLERLVALAPRAGG